jgi:hypothetical protein
MLRVFFMQRFFWPVSCLEFRPEPTQVEHLMVPFVGRLTDGRLPPLKLALDKHCCLFCCCVSDEETSLTTLTPVANVIKHFWRNLRPWDRIHNTTLSS